MATYHKEGLREELRYALLVLPRTRGQLDGFGTSGYSSKYAKVNSRVECGVRIKAEPVRTLACKTFKRSPMPLPDQAFVYTRIVRAMNQAPGCCADWLRYCYSDGAQLPTVDLLQSLLAKFQQEETRAMRGTSKELIKHLALLACQQKRDAINAGKELLPRAQLAALAGKSEEAWKKNWASRWNRLLRILETFDQEGLDYVYEHGRRSKAARRNADLPVQRRVRSGAGAQVAACVGV